MCSLFGLLLGKGEMGVEWWAGSSKERASGATVFGSGPVENERVVEDTRRPAVIVGPLAR